MNAQLAPHILALADDELILGHRNSEWCGHAPILEEDIAFANLALDEIGHAMLWYQLHAHLVGADPETHPDQLAYFREPFEFRCAHLVALPKGDWAFTIVRQYLFDTLETTRLSHYAQSAFTPLAETAAKIRREEIYHLRHTSAWVTRLGLGTEESHRRMQTALDELWPYTGQLFDPLPGEDDLVRAGWLPASATLQTAWHAQVIPFLESANLRLPAAKMRTLARTLPSQHLVNILADLQQVARLDPQAAW
ncbi:MAG: phenylacetate-CoA oxygenase subunit PaaC [Anaerolineales bacterium]|nr:phenylacetate-CoA oxygenase subunit PaaC [Anaerolineales bacterium]